MRRDGMLRNPPRDGPAATKTFDARRFAAMLSVRRMPFTPPTDAVICRSFPELRTIQFRCSGGFKAVYLAQTAAGTEAFKLLCLPAADASPEEQAARREHLARA